MVTEEPRDEQERTEPTREPAFEAASLSFLGVEKPMARARMTQRFCVPLVESGNSADTDSKTRKSTVGRSCLKISLAPMALTVRVGRCSPPRHDDRLLGLIAHLGSGLG